jgi:hypothetical protein
MKIKTHSPMRRLKEALRKRSTEGSAMSIVSAMFRSVASRRAAGTAWIAKGKEIERNIKKKKKKNCCRRVSCTYRERDAAKQLLDLGDASELRNGAADDSGVDALPVHGALLQESDQSLALRGLEGKRELADETV